MAITLNGNGTSTFSNNITSSNGDLTLGDGNLVVADGHGIDFSANANAAGMQGELLNDYERGTWTPTIVTGTNGDGDGNYVKVGNLVYITGYFGQISDTTSSASVLINLPFPSSTRSTGSVFVRGTNPVPAACYINPSSNQLYFYTSSTGEYASIQHRNLGAGAQFFFGVSYYAD